MASTTGEFSGAVGRGEAVVLEQGYGLAGRAQRIPNTPATLFQIASIRAEALAVG
jgi:CubicO group peptidase (beta-lactamase class C family)